MCGIVGSNGQEFLYQDIQSGLNKIKYRGPDQTVITKISQNTFLGMNRLAIRDLQPNLYPFKFKNFLLIINGEIYNIAELKNKLPNFKAKTNCDAEYILPLFEKYGNKSFNLLKGMFALAIYDNKNKKIYLARDKFGEKPLYYYFHHHSFFFASEISAFPKKIKKINKQSIPKFLTFGFIPDHHTFFKNIYKLKLGQYLTYDLTKQKAIIYKYHQIQITALPKTNHLNLTKPIINLEKKLSQIISEKLVSDVPIGFFLSGGVDSSLITALAVANSSKTIHTFSIHFHEKSTDESKAALIVSKYLKTKHTQITITGTDIHHNWNKIIGSLDEPISDPAIFPTYILARVASKTVKVIFSGEGADEIFGGYKIYFKENQSRLKFPFFNHLFLALHQSRYWKIFSPINYHYTPIFYNIFWSDSFKSKKLFQKIIQNSWHKIKNPSSPQLHDLNHYLPEQLCMKMDKMTMQHSIESRAPFLDPDLLQFLPISSKLIEKKYPPKYILRKVAERYLPHQIAWRPKHGFAIPLKKWLKNDLSKELESLQQTHPLILDFVKPKTIKLLVDNFIKYGHNELSIWNLITLNSWLKINHY